MANATLFDRVAARVDSLIPPRIVGRVSAVTGTSIYAVGLPAPVGARCEAYTDCGRVVEAEVVGLKGGQAVLSVFNDATGLSPGDAIALVSASAEAPVGFDLLGRVIDGQGRALDNGPQPLVNYTYPLQRDPPPPLERRAIDAPLGLGVRAIDGLLTAGLGQRLGVFAGTGVGKSVLMGMLCRNTQADVNVVALIGERGREVGDFIETQLGTEGLKRSVVIACTSDQAPALRVRACFLATAIAEFFRDQGLDVLLMMDSLTRMAMAQRQIGLAAGEPPTLRGYPPSAFALLPRLLERAGRTRNGSITGIYTVLVEGDDIDEPLSDTVRGILDGHIWLARRLANRGHYPAIDVLASISRVAQDVTSPAHREAAQEVRGVLATWAEIEDLVSVGAYVPGANEDYDVAVQTREVVNAFLRQSRDDKRAFGDTTKDIEQLAELIRRTRSSARPRHPGANK